LDEDDLSAIIVRRLVEEFELFKDKEVIALNKTADLKLPKDKKKFSSIIALWTINEMLIDPKKVYPKYVGAKTNLVKIRPDENIIETYKSEIFSFWNTFFSCFPTAKSFIEQVDENIRSNGGPFSLRPVGQQIFCDYYLKMKSLNRINEIEIIKEIPDDLSNTFWHNVLFDPIGQRIIGSRSYARDYLYYHLGLPLTNKQVNSLLKNYRKYTQNENAQLPAKQFVPQ
jgi:DNA sulfur modification protein DndB